MLRTLIFVALTPLSVAIGLLLPAVSHRGLQHPISTDRLRDPRMFFGTSSAAPKPKAAKKSVKSVAKKPVAKKSVTKKTIAKKSTAKKKPVAKKPVAKKPIAKKPIAKKTFSTRNLKPQFETLADLEVLALEQNTALGFFDPLGLSKRNFWDQGESATIGFLRHAEIKHGRVAMAAFVGYCVQANGIAWPWAITGGPLVGTGLFGNEPTVMFSDIAAAGSPGDQFDALPTAAKVQILLTIGILEYIGETPQKGGMPHYMRGGKPGYYPPLKTADGVPHPVPFNLYDPFNLFDEMDAETKARRLNMEINNGRLAMFGIFSLLSASKGLIVPGLDGLVQPYSGQYMAYFSSGDVGLPFVEKMLNIKLGTINAF